jgi:hypothetical protein
MAIPVDGQAGNQSQLHCNLSMAGRQKCVLIGHIFSNLIVCHPDVYSRLLAVPARHSSKPAAMTNPSSMQAAPVTLSMYSSSNYKLMSKGCQNSSHANLPKPLSMHLLARPAVAIN